MATAQRPPITTSLSPGPKLPTCDTGILDFDCLSDAIFSTHDLPFLAAFDIAAGSEHFKYQSRRFGMAVVHFGGSSGLVAKSVKPTKPANGHGRAG